MTRVATHPALSVPEIHPGIRIAHSGLDAGNMDPRFGETTDVIKSRAWLCQSAGLDSHKTTYAIVPQSKTDIVDVDADADTRIQPKEEYNEIDVIADALVTTRKSTGLMLNAADCIPLVMFEPGKNILALVHVGWRGAVAGYHGKVQAYLSEQYGFNAENSLAYLGPSIQQQSYSSDSLHDSQVDNPDWEPYICERKDAYHIDMPGFVTSGLIRSGINPNKIYQSKVDTGHVASEHFSFTRHKSEGVANGRNGFIATIL